MSSINNSFSTQKQQEDVCQLATYFSCTCSKCMGDFTPTISSSSASNNNNNKSSYEDLYQLQFTTTVSAPLSEYEHNNNNSSFISTCTQQQEQEQGEEKEEFSFIPSSSSSCVSAQVEVKLTEEELEILRKVEQIQQQEQQQVEHSTNNKPLSRRQKKKQHQKSFLDIAKSLRDSPKTFRNKPSQFVFPVDHKSLPFWYTPEDIEERMMNQYINQRKEKRRTFRRLNRRQLLPDWCYNANENSQRALREMVAVLVGEMPATSVGTTDSDFDFLIYDRRATLEHIRLPRSTAIAHRNKNKWIVKNRIFGCTKPFRNSTVDWSDDASLNKPDTRGLVHFERMEKFQGKDDREKHNRNGGYHRRDYRNNGYHQGRQIYMGNSRKDIFGKPWLHARAAKINKGYDRLQESGWLSWL